MSEENTPIQNQIREAFQRQDIETVEKLVNENREIFRTTNDEDIDETTFRIAIEEDCVDYIAQHCFDIELNSIDGYSPYLYMTDNKLIQNILMDAGASKNLDDYCDCLFAMETVNGLLLALDDDFRKEIVTKMLSVSSLDETTLAAMIEDNTLEEYEYPESCPLSDSLDCICNALALSAADGQLEYESIPFDDSDSGYVILDLIRDLGWNPDFEGDMWKLETCGVYFIAR